MNSSSLLVRDLAYISITAMAGGLLAWRVNLPLILGFVLGGVVISPFTPGFQTSDTHTFHEAAEAGVVLLMFSIGGERCTHRTAILTGMDFAAASYPATTG